VCSIGTGPDEDFHEYEWNKHGTCNMDSLDAHDYFKKTLDLHEKYNVEVRPVHAASHDIPAHIT